jgi:hypothetical protein
MMGSLGILVRQNSTVTAESVTISGLQEWLLVLNAALAVTAQTDAAFAFPAGGRDH